MQDHEDHRGTAFTRAMALGGLAAGLVLVILSLDLLIHPQLEEGTDDSGD